MTEAERAVIDAAVEWGTPWNGFVPLSKWVKMENKLKTAIAALNAERAAAPQTQGGGGGAGYVELRQDVPGV